MSSGGTQDTGIYTVYSETGKVVRITDKDINKAVKKGAKGIGLFKKKIGYVPNDVSSHSLRAGGAMAMHLKGASPPEIRLQGRWNSDTFTTYVHEQISAFSAGLSEKMSRRIPFRKISGPRVSVVTPERQQ